MCARSGLVDVQQKSKPSEIEERTNQPSILVRVSNGPYFVARFDALSGVSQIVETRSRFKVSPAESYLYKFL